MDVAIRLNRHASPASDAYAPLQEREAAGGDGSCGTAVWSHPSPVGCGESITGGSVSRVGVERVAGILPIERLWGGHAQSQRKFCPKAGVIKKSPPQGESRIAHLRMPAPRHKLPFPRTTKLCRETRAFTLTAPGLAARGRAAERRYGNAIAIAAPPAVRNHRHAHHRGRRDHSRVPALPPSVRVLRSRRWQLRCTCRVPSWQVARLVVGVQCHVHTFCRGIRLCRRLSARAHGHSPSPGLEHW